MNRLDNILEPNYEERGLQRPTSVARHVMSTTPKKCFDQVMNELRCNKDDPSNMHSRVASVNQSEHEVNISSPPPLATHKRRVVNHINH